MGKIENYLREEFAKAWADFVFSKTSQPDHGKLLGIATKAVSMARKEELKRITAKDLFGLIELKKMVEGYIETPDRAKLLVDWIKDRDFETAKKIFLEMDSMIYLDEHEDTLMSLGKNDAYKQLKKKFLSLKPQSDNGVEGE